MGPGQYWAKRALYASTRMTDAVAALMIVGALAGCWVIAWLVGGAATAPPHWFYLPVIFAGLRFGPLVALAAAVAAGLVGGPLLSLDVDAGTSQAAASWVTAAVFYVVIGQIVAFVSARPVGELADELRRLRLAEDLRRALERGEFHVVYQPVVSLVGGEIVGTEALLRWTRQDGSTVSPAVFIPVAEESGVISAIGEWVLREACLQAAAWVRSLPEGRPLHMSVNLSGHQLTEPHLASRVQKILDETGLPPQVLILEVTETALIESIDASVTALTGLKHLGVGLAIDDFGTGQSSLTYAHRFPVDIIKVDRSFVTDIETEANSAAVAGGVVSLAHNLGMQALAEGIETVGQLALLQSMGCDLGQGFYFDRPAPAEAVSARLALANP